jgi:hypothetical protein
MSDAAGYLKITLEVVIREDDSEVFTQALNNAMDVIEEQTTVYLAEITTAATGEPDNAAEIGAPK